MKFFKKISKQNLLSLMSRFNYFAVLEEPEEEYEIIFPNKNNTFRTSPSCIFNKI